MTDHIDLLTVEGVETTDHEACGSARGWWIAMAVIFGQCRPIVFVHPVEARRYRSLSVCHGRLVTIHKQQTDALHSLTSVTVNQCAVNPRAVRPTDRPCVIRHRRRWEFSIDAVGRG
jgi:hypothetical protein